MGGGEQRGAGFPGTGPAVPGTGGQGLLREKELVLACNVSPASFHGPHNKEGLHIGGLVVFETNLYLVTNTMNIIEYTLLI